MSKCRKTKNPCKICLRPVTRKNGLQCEGVCESWVHYECLNYTPGKIQDIKKRVIKVTCPCPDCKSTLPKEHRLVEPFTCTNAKCPANRPPRCTSKKCPLGVPEEKSGCSLSQCGNSCKENSSQSRICKENTRKTSPAAVGASRPLRREAFEVSEGCGTPCHTNRDAFTDNTSSSSSWVSKDVPGDYCQTASGIEDVCATVGQLTNQINDLMQKMKGVLECSRGNKTQFQPCHCPGNPCRK